MGRTTLDLTLEEGWFVQFRRVHSELRQAEAQHPPYRSAHEGFALILEEVDELRAVVFEQDHDIRDLKDNAAHKRAPAEFKRTKLALARLEAIQVACTAIRFLDMVDRQLEELEDDDGG